MHLLAFATKAPSLMLKESGGLVVTLTRGNNVTCLEIIVHKTHWPLLSCSWCNFAFAHSLASRSHFSLDPRRPVFCISSRKWLGGPCLGPGISWIGQWPDNCPAWSAQARSGVTGLRSPQHSMIFLGWCYGNECRMAEAREQAKETALILVYWQYTILCCYFLS